MSRRLLLLAALAGAAAPHSASAEEVVRRVGRVTIRVDLTQGFAGGVLIARLSGTRLGAAWALLDGRRAPFYRARGGLRALVPVAASTDPGPATLGIGIAARGGEQRIAVSVAISARAYASRNVFLGEAKRALLDRPEVLHDARRLLGFVRSESASAVPGPLVPPVASAGRGFGERRTYGGLADVESRTDGLGGVQHRGIDYPVPVGPPVRSPGTGIVLFAGRLALSGETVVVDHGQGVVSVLEHLAGARVREGDTVAAGSDVAFSGDSGLAAEPLLQWRVYLHAVPVDPLALALALGD
jgi:murein DD-endopeptidase MepM/ murein hydrolase activator NlpD